MRIDALQLAPATLPAHDGREAAATGKVLPPATAPVVVDVHQAADLIDRFLRDAGRELSFSVDRVTGRTIVSVRDPATGELIRQMPSEEVLRIARNLDLVHSALISEQA